MSKLQKLSVWIRGKGPGHCRRQLTLHCDFIWIPSLGTYHTGNLKKLVNAPSVSQVHPNHTRHWAYGFSPMLATCLHSKPLTVSTVVFFPVHNACGPLRCFATAAPPRSQFPYPLHPRPTPYQIFHLPRGASQKQVKDRCECLEAGICSLVCQILMFSSVVFSEDYELVRVHHPDSPNSRASDLPKRIRDERFSSIKDAHDILTGKRPGHPSQWNSSDCGRDWELRNELERRRHRGASWEPQAHAYSRSHYTRQHAPHSDGPVTLKDRRRDNILICVAFLVRTKPFRESPDTNDSSFVNSPG